MRERCEEVFTDIQGKALNGLNLQENNPRIIILKHKRFIIKTLTHRSENQDVL